jgi:DNA adenine methylase
MLSDLTPHLHRLLNGATAYHEPFVGGGSVLLWVAQHYPRLPLYANDFDPGVAGFWNCILNQKAVHEMCDRLPRPSEVNVDLFRDWLKRKPATEVERGLRTLLLNRWGQSSSKGLRPMGGRSQAGENRISDRYKPEKLMAKLWKCHELLAGRCVVSCEDAKRCIGFCDPEEPEHETQAIFLDPPYIKKGPMLYSVWMTKEQHARLAWVLSGVRCPWLMTLDEDAFALSLYDKVERIMAVYSSTGKRVTNKRARELLIRRTHIQSEEAWDKLTGLGL